MVVREKDAAAHGRAPRAALWQAAQGAKRGSIVRFPPVLPRVRQGVDQR
ncbi:hypothetical protein OH686_21835 [Pseudomonas sp. SO81]|nr:hypothetical protein OH686_21835 [Pseudomonas sp. SO81]